VLTFFRCNCASKSSRPHQPHPRCLSHVLIFGTGVVNGMGGCLSQSSTDSSPLTSPNPPSRRPGPLTSRGTPPPTSTDIPMARLDTLRTYATLPKPSTALPPSTLLLSTPHTIAILDAYPKAKYHFLILPRHPFAPRSEPEETRSIARLSDLDDLRSLLTKTSPEVREQIIGALAETASEVEEMIRDEMVKTEGFEWGIDIGFHAIPSMK
jgi:diadenosine tetraphosphate (Ap4A) HIT family hydrolase